jgi:hypothetical protein
VRHRADQSEEENASPDRKTRQDKTKQDKTRQDRKTRQDKTRQVEKARGMVTPVGVAGRTSR